MNLSQNSNIKKYSVETNVVEVLKNREANLLSWLSENATYAIKEQRHLDHGSKEQAYWNYGYFMAIKDILALITGASISNH